MPELYDDDAGSILDSPIGVTGVREGGSGANLSATSGYWKQATAGAPVVPVSEFALGDLPDGAANSVLGRAAGSSGVLANIASSAIGDTLRNRNGTLTWARNVFNVYDFGAVGDNATDDLTAINACWTAALASGHLAPVVYFPPCAGYAVSAPIAFTLAAGGPLSVVMDGRLRYTGSAQTGAFFTIGITGSVKNVTGSYFRLWVDRATQSNWSDDSHAGIKLINFNNCLVDIVAVDYFTTGVQCIGVGDGFAYNTIDLGRILNCRYGVDFTHDDTGGVDGWCNGNRLRGGRFAYNLTGGASDTTHRYAARFRTQDARLTSPNSIEWWHPTVEIGKAGDSYATGHGFLFERGNAIYIHGAHIEGANEAAIFLGNATTPASDPYENTVELAYSMNLNALKDDRSSHATNIVIGANRRYAREADKLIYEANNVASMATPYNSTTISLRGIAALITGPSIAPTVAKGATTLDYGADHLSVGSNAVLGVKITGNSTKQFFITSSIAGGTSRVVVQAFDSTGAIITSSGNWTANTAYLLSERIQPTSANINGFWYRCTSPGTTHATTEPTWPTTVGATVVDSGATWTCEGPAPIRGNFNATWVYNSGFGGIWRTTTGVTEGFFEVNAQVASFFVGISAGASNAQLREIKLYAVTPPNSGQTPAVTLGYSATQNWNRRVAAQSPTTSGFGTHSVGDVVFNGSNTTTATGWRCTTAGTPGTFKSFGDEVSRVSTQFDKTSDTTLANITGLTATVAAGVTYGFEADLYTSSNASGGVKFAIAGTATATAIIYESVLYSAGVSVAVGTARATALATAVGDLTAVTAARCVIRGTITVNAAGTLLPQFSQNASFGTASSVLVGSTFTVTEVA